VDEVFALRRRMVRLLTVVLFPLLTLLVLLAPVFIPWLFGPEWTAAVVPTQILTGAGAATVVIDAAGTVLMASGRARAMLLYGVAHFAVYIAAVFVASSRGLVPVCIAAAGVHAIFVVVAYQVLLRGRGERALRFLWRDISAATVSCVALVVAALPVELALSAGAVSALPHLLLVAGAGLTGYLAVLRVAFGTAWRDLVAFVVRVLPARSVGRVIRRVPLLAGRSS
jgi:O-antigen/teichoic acid export membrane protein